MQEIKYKGWLTELTNESGEQGFQVRIDSSEGYFIIEIIPNTKSVKIIKDRMNNEKQD